MLGCRCPPNPQTPTRTHAKSTHRAGGILELVKREIEVALVVLDRHLVPAVQPKNAPRECRQVTAWDREQD